MSIRPTHRVRLRALGWFAAGLFLGASDDVSGAAGPSRPLRDYAHKVWGVKDGLPQVTADSITQTRDGYLWIGTQEGVARFDGVRFTVYDKSNTPGFVHKSIQSLFEGRDGSLWVGTVGGLVRLRNGPPKSFTQADGLCADVVTGLVEDSAGRLLVGSLNSGLGVLENGRFRCYTEADGLGSNLIRTLTSAASGELYVGTSRGLDRFRDGRIDAVADVPDGLDVRAVLEDSTGRLWLGTATGLWVREQGRWGLREEGQINAILEDRSGAIWVATERRGVCRRRGGAVEHFGEAEGLTDPHARALHQDREGSIWIGTYGGGLNALMDGSFTAVSKRDGLPNDYARAVFESSDGSMWIGTEGGLAHLQEDRITSYTARDGLCGDDVRTIDEDPRGDIWIGTFGGGACRFRNGRFDGLGEDLAASPIYAVLADGPGRVWIGSRGGGLNRWDQGRLVTFTRRDGLAGNQVRAIRKRRGGGLWVATSTGLSHFEDGSFKNYTTRDGLSHDFTYSLYEDDSGTLWIGTYGGGLSRLKDGRFTAYRMADGLFDDTIFQILEDDQGFLWMSCNKGVFRVAKQELDEFATGARDSIRCESYSESDGMRNRECNGSAQPAGTRTVDGRLWFPTLAGVAIVDPRAIRRNEVVPPVVIERLLADGESRDLSDPDPVPPGQGELEIQYTGVSFVAPERMRFRYRLEGFDQDWVDAGLRRAAYYTNLPPGEFRFRVQASNSDGVWNQRGASLAIQLAPHFHQTVWFYGLCGLAAIGTGIGFFRLRIRRLRQRERVLREQVKEQTEIIRERLENEAALERRCRSLIDGANDIIYTHDLRGNLLTLNRAGSRITGCTEEEIRALRLQDLVVPEQQEVVDDWLRKVAVGRPLPPFEMEILSTGGHRHILEATASLVEANGGRQEIEGIARDVTDRKRSEKLLLAKQAAEEANRAKSAFLANMSHELRTPLNAVIGYSEMIEEEAEEAGHRQYRDDLGKIRSAGHQLLNLVNDVLDLSKIESGKMDLYWETFATAGLLRELTDFVEPLAKRNGNRFVLESDGSPEFIHADRTRFRQSLLNLLSNACKFTEGGTVTLTVENRRLESSDWVYCTVQDSGIGIAREQRGKLFHHFSQVDSSETRKYGGTGLGLGISRRRFLAMGEIEIVFWDVAGEHVYSESAADYYTFLSALVRERHARKSPSRSYAFAPILMCNPLSLGIRA